MSDKKSSGILYIVATHIGNPRDITLRAMDVLRSVNAVVCEELRQGSTLMKKLGLNKQLICLNEHNESEQIPEICQKLLQNEDLALISDCGTPVFADPGAKLLHQAIKDGIPIIPVPGPSSLMAALSVLDFKVDNFLFAGFLPRETAPRIQALQKYRALRIPVILMDTPYRLDKLLQEVGQVFGNNQNVTLAFDLTLMKEQIFRGNIVSVRRKVQHSKGEFVLIVHPPSRG